jgi:hypothetical protein
VYHSDIDSWCSDSDQEKPVGAGGLSRMRNKSLEEKTRRIIIINKRKRYSGPGIFQAEAACGKDLEYF